jgi:ribosome maturation factor RimP
MEEFVVQLGHEENELKKIIEPLLDGEGFELVRILLKRTQGKAILGLFVDTKDRPNGIMMENLEFISRFISDVLDAASLEENILSGSYDLEVSSPGLDRPLTKISHFQNAVAERVKVRLKQADTSGSRNIVGKLVGASSEGISIEPDGKKDESRAILFADLAEAHIIFDFNKKRPLSKKSS